MAPQAPRKKPPVVRGKSKPTHKLKPGDLVCGQCGEGNAPVRKFCARCGASLDVATVVKTPWWRKLLPKRKPKTMGVGERPGKGGRPARKRLGLAAVARPLRAFFAVLLVVGALIYSAVPAIRQTVNDKIVSAKDTLTNKVTKQFDPVRPAKISEASSESPPDHTAAKAFDNFKNTWWEAKLGDAKPHVLIDFAEPTDIDKIIVYNGSADAFASSSRPLKLELVFINTNKTDTITLEDTPDAKTYTVHNGQRAQRVELIVTERSIANQGPDQIALSEVEFFTRRK